MKAKSWRRRSPRLWALHCSAWVTPLLLTLEAPAGSAGQANVTQASATSQTVLFIGNSFTSGYGSTVQFFRPQSVADLNSRGIGGVPALFRIFTAQAGLDFAVSLETVGGRAS